MKSISFEKAMGIMDGMAFILAMMSEKLGLDVDSIEDTTRSFFEHYCEVEGIEAVEKEG